MPQDKLPEPGEFTRMFKRQHLGSPANAEDAGKGDNAVDATEKGIVPPGLSADSTASGPPRSSAPSGSPNPPAGVPANEPGEFTQYFLGGVAKNAAKPSPPPSPRTFSGVQRPNSPLPPRSLANDTSSGSFTERFSPPVTPPPNLAKTEEYGVHNPRVGPVPDLTGRPAQENRGGPFDFRPEVPQPLPSKESSSSEYTALFGRGNTPPASRQSAIAPTPSAPLMSDSPNSSRNAAPPSFSRPQADVPPVPEAPRGPSEYTIVSGGRQSPTSPAVGTPPADAAPSVSAARKLPVQANINPVNPLGSLASGGGMPHLSAGSANVSAAGANVSSPFGSASLHAPPIPPLAMPAAKMPALNEQTKLILFFAVLAILAVVLVVFVIVTQKN